MGNLLPRKNNQSATTPTELDNDGARTEKEMKEEEIYLSTKTMMHLINALADEVIVHGEAEAYLINHEHLTDKQVATIMKTNTFLTAFATLLLKIVEKENPKFAKMILDIWVSSPVKDLVRIAFADEIASAVDNVAAQIDELEKIINEGN
jgi:hypothetical protein